MVLWLSTFPDKCAVNQIITNQLTEGLTWGFQGPWGSGAQACFVQAENIAVLLFLL